MTLTIPPQSSKTQRQAQRANQFMQSLDTYFSHSTALSASVGIKVIQIMVLSYALISQDTYKFEKVLHSFQLTAALAILGLTCFLLVENEPCVSASAAINSTNVNFTNAGDTTEASHDVCIALTLLTFIYQGYSSGVWGLSELFRDSTTTADATPALKADDTNNHTIINAEESSHHL